MSGAGVALDTEAARKMTVQLIRTKAESGFSEHFEAAKARLPGNEAVRRLRREAIGRFAGHGLPHRRIEEWKYTDLRSLLKDAPALAAGGLEGERRHFVKRALHAALEGDDRSGDWMLFADGRQITANGKLAGMQHSLADVLDDPPSWLMSEIERAAGAEGDGVVALNAALMSGGVVLDVPDGADFSAPVHIVFEACGAKGPDGDDARSVFTRNVIRVGKGARLTLVETHAASAPRPRLAGAVTQLLIGEGAEVVHIKAVDTAAGESHLGTTIVRMSANAGYRPFQLVSGVGLVRNGLRLAFEGQHSSLDFAGVTLGQASSHADTTMFVDHAVPHCTSRELFKAVLGDRSRAVFQGKVVVRPGAQKTDGKQMAKGLMLSPEAEFDSKPELEIYADDVVCGHGSTAAEIDHDLLFYCRSRGIPLAEARALLIESFIGEAIDKISHEGLRGAVARRAGERLADYKD